MHLDLGIKMDQYLAIHEKQALQNMNISQSTRSCVAVLQNNGYLIKWRFKNMDIWTSSVCGSEFSWSILCGVYRILFGMFSKFCIFHLSKFLPQICIFSCISHLLLFDASSITLLHSSLVNHASLNLNLCASPIFQPNWVARDCDQICI